jgi:mono/diheme cytochrome c family protein
VPGSDEVLLKGRALYQKNCGSCHGAKGKGDGSGIRFLAERTSRRPKDLTDAKLQASLSDGEIFWKVTTGLKEDTVIVMPAYANEIKKDEDRWALVHFVRTLAARD